MSNIKLVSSKKLIAELLSDYNIEGTDWIPKANRHISRGIETMELHGYYEIAVMKHDVVDYMAPLPCSQRALYCVLLLTGEKKVAILPIDNNPLTGRNFKDYPSVTLDRGMVNYDHLHTTFETGTIIFVYWRIPLDKEYNPMVPDDAFVFDALPFYVIMKLGYSGYIHPVISREEAEIKWRELYPRARNKVNYPTIQDMDNFTYMNTDPYFEFLFNYQYASTLDDALPVMLSQAFLEPEEDLTVVTQSIGVVQAIDLETGWITYTNLTYTEGSPFNVVAATPTKIPLGTTVVNDTEAPESLKNIIDPVTFEIGVNNTGDAFIGRISFKLKTTLANRSGRLFFDIGDEGQSEVIEFNSSSFNGNASAGVEEAISIVIPFYQLETFATNKAKVMVEIDGEADIYDINLFLTKTYHGGSNG